MVIVKQAALLIILLFSYNAQVAGKGIDFSKLSIGIGGSYYLTTNDILKHWGNFPAGVLKLKYAMDNNFILSGGLAAGIVKADSPVKSMPDFLFIDLFAGVVYKLPFASNMLSIQAGLVNDIFSFSEGEAELISENDVEQEVGYYIGAELSLLKGLPLSNSELTLEVRYSQVFSEPENITFTNIGLVFYFL